MNLSTWVLLWVAVSLISAAIKYVGNKYFKKKHVPFWKLFLVNTASPITLIVWLGVKLARLIF